MFALLIRELDFILISHYESLCLYFQIANMQLHIGTCFCLVLGFGSIAADALTDQKKPNLLMDDIEGKHFVLL